mgnify:CR=1 FL=1
MGNIFLSVYKAELINAMNLVMENPKALIIGQCCLYSGHIMYSTIEHLPKDRVIEFPVAEDMQLGASIGLAIQGFLPISIFPRVDFLLLAINQLVNHLDKLETCSHGQWQPKVIIRTMIGSLTPLYPGPQHCGDYTEGLRAMLCNVDVIRLEHSSQIMPAYRAALASPRSTILIEAPMRREGYEED